MIKDYINDLFTEGLGNIFYVKIKNNYQKKIKSPKIYTIINTIHIILYLVLVLLVSIGIFLISYPL